MTGAGPSNGVDPLLRRYYLAVVNVWTSPSAQETIDELLAADVMFHPPIDVAGQAGLDRHTAFLTWHHTAFPDQQFMVNELIVADDAAACRSTLTGTHSGPFLGVESTGRRVQVSGIDFFHISGERITEFWRSFDLRILLNQLAPN